MTLARSLSVLSLCLVTAACGPADLKRDEVNANLFPAEGELGGYDFGDAWEEIKANHAEVFEVRDDDFKQLRRKVHENAGSDGYFIGFSLDDAGKVESFDASINGTKQNAVTVRALLDDVIAHYDETIGGGGCMASGGPGNSSTCTWRDTPGKPRVEVMYFEMSDPISGSINIRVEPPASEP